MYNDVIDEEIDLEKPEEIGLQNKKIENNHIDEVVQISSEEGEDVPSPREEQAFDDEAKNMQFGQNTGGDLGGEGGEGGFEGYNPKDYMNLNVSQEVKGLFRFITNYVPVVSEIDPILKPFIPEYIPTVGEVDAYLKIPKVFYSILKLIARRSARDARSLPNRRTGIEPDKEVGNGLHYQRVLYGRDY